MKNRTKILLASFASVLIYTACTNKQNDDNIAIPAKLYPAVAIKLQNAELETQYPIVLKGQEDIEIKPRIDGFIDAVYVDEGSKVVKGAPLFKINSPTADQNVEKALASYNSAKLDMERMRPLAEKGIISHVRIEGYQNALSVAKAALEQAKAMQGWTVVRSPINGYVGIIPFREGSLVNNGNVLTIVSNTRTVMANFSMNEKKLYEFLKFIKGNTQAEKIKNMPPVKLILADGHTYPLTGKIETIAGLVDAVSGAVGFRASFPNPDGVLRSGSSGQIVLPYILENVPVIPQKATFRMQDKIMAFKIKNDIVVQTVIEVNALPDGKHYAVTNGLVAGDSIVTDGIATLRDGIKIQTINK